MYYNIQKKEINISLLSYVLELARIYSLAIYITNNAKEDLNLGGILWKPKMLTQLARGDLSKHLHNLIRYPWSWKGQSRAAPSK